MGTRKETHEEMADRHRSIVSEVRERLGGHVSASHAADEERKAIQAAGGFDKLDIDDKTGKPVEPKPAPASDAKPTPPAAPKAKKVAKKK